MLICEVIAVQVPALKYLNTARPRLPDPFCLFFHFDPPHSTTLDNTRPLQFLLINYFKTSVKDYFISLFINTILYSNHIILLKWLPRLRPRQSPLLVIMQAMQVRAPLFTTLRLHLIACILSWSRMSCAHGRCFGLYKELLTDAFSLQT